MTEENYAYRTSQSLLRNQFTGSGTYQMPMIPRFKPETSDFDDLLLLGFDRIRMDDERHLDRMVHFFLYDYKFERVWKDYEHDVSCLARYRAVLSPDFSMYLEMARVCQIYNTFRNRWCGAFWASKGLRVVPTVNWGDESTFDFCFDGIEKGSVVAVSTYMASAHDNRSDQKDWFLPGYREMLRRIEPEKVICYNTPFPEMEGDIVFVDYERSSWKYQNILDSYQKDDLEDFLIGGANSGKYDIIAPFIDIPMQKGGGSAYGGIWKPSKPEDERFLGQPGETKKSGEKETHIGVDGRADRERHNTDHNRPDKHSNPHDHEITWDERGPHPGPPINYTDDVPDFKKYKAFYVGGIMMQRNTPEQNRFKTISDFKWCINRGGEVEFMWKGICYGVVRYGTNNKITIYEAYKPETEKVCDTADDALEYMVGTDRLRDVITQVTVIDRTI